MATLLVPVDCLETILSIAPDIRELEAFCIDSNVDIIEVFTSDVVSNSNSFRVRVFAPKFGYLEDPATGSGNSALGYYLIKNNIWNSSNNVSIEQNGERDAYNIVKLIKNLDDHGNDRVFFGGKGIVRIEGKYIL